MDKLTVTYKNMTYKNIVYAEICFIYIKGAKYIRSHSLTIFTKYSNDNFLGYIRTFTIIPSNIEIQGTPEFTYFKIKGPASFICYNESA